MYQAMTVQMNLCKLSKFGVNLCKAPILSAGFFLDILSEIVKATYLWI